MIPSFRRPPRVVRLLPGLTVNRFCTDSVTLARARKPSASRRSCYANWFACANVLIQAASIWLAVEGSARAQGVSDDARTRADRGRELIEAGRWAEARDELTAAIRLEDDREHWFLLGRACQHLGQDRQAVFAYRAVLARDPKNASAVNNLAWLLATSDDDAVHDGLQALRILHDQFDGGQIRSPTVFDTFAAAHAAAGQFDQAVQLAGRGLAVLDARDDPRHVRFRQAMAARLKLFELKLPYRRLLVETGSGTVRRRDADKAAKMYRWLASRSAHVGDHHAAVRLWRAVLVLAPADVAARNDLGLSLGQLGRYAEAADAFRLALRRNPKDPLVTNNLAWLLATCPDAAVRKGDDAVRLAEQLIASAAGDDPAHLDTLAAALAESGRFDDAVRTAERARALALKAGANDLAEQFARRLSLYATRNRFRTAKPAAARRRETTALQDMVSEIVARFSQRPELRDPVNRLARLLATSAQAGCRDAEMALTLATGLTAVGGNRRADDLETLAAAYAGTGQFDLALAAVHHALATEPPPDERQRQRLHRARRNYTDRFTPWEEVAGAPVQGTSRRSKLAHACYVVASELENRRRVELADEFYGLTLQIDPTHVAARRRRGRLRLHHADAAAAVSDLYIAAMLDGDDPGLLVDLGTALRVQGVAQGAVDLLRAAVQLEPSQREPTLRLAGSWRPIQ